MRIDRRFFERSVHEVAPDLVGTTLLVDGCGGVVVEVEAYDREDPAAHGFRGRTERNASMFGPAGRAYVYRSYGIHWCLNLVCEEAGNPAAVLIRALEPTAGLALMRERRGLEETRLLCAGPGRLCQALGVTREHDGLVAGRAAVRAARGGRPGRRGGRTPHRHQRCGRAAVALRHWRAPATSAGRSAPSARRRG